MKSFLILFILLIATAFASYADPPISNVMNHNEQVTLFGTIASGTNGFDNCVVETNPSLIANRGAIDRISIRAISVFPAVDNRVSYADPPYVFWSYGEQHKNTTTWETTLSGTSCTSSAEFVSFEPKATIAFTIGNSSASVITSENKVPIPNNMKDILDENNEKNLTVSMDGTGTYVYDLEVYSVVCTPNSGCSCEKNTEASGEKELRFRCKNSISYEIENQDIVSLLQKPILKEQWYQNNHFDSLLLTNRKIYKTEVVFNNITFGNITFYKFEVITDKYGLERITTLASYYENNATGAESIMTVIPIPLQKKNNTFRYAYEINSTYDGIGLNTLTLKAYDDFGQKIEVSEEIMSKELSFSGNISESNKAIDNDDQSIRASSAWNPMTYNLLFLTLGVAGLLIVFVVFKMRWD